MFYKEHYVLAAIANPKHRCVHSQNSHLRSSAPLYIVERMIIKLCKCGNQARPNQRYCLQCHAAAMRKTRPKYKDLPPLRKMKAATRAYTHLLVKRGKLERLPCKRCGESNAEVHHEKYPDPRVITWLCRRCHIEHHRQATSSPLPPASAAPSPPSVESPESSG